MTTPPAPLTFQTLTRDLYQGDIEQFIAKIKLSPSLKPALAKDGGAEAAAIKLLGHLQTRSELGDMPPEIVEMIATNLDDPQHVRNLNSISKDFRGSVSRRVGQLGNRIPLTRITSQTIADIKSKYPPEEVESEIEKLESNVANEYFYILDTLSFRRLFRWENVQRFIHGKGLDYDNPRVPFDDLEVLNDLQKREVVEAAMELFDPDTATMEFEELIQILEFVNAFNGSVAGHIVLDASMLREVQTYEPLMQRILLNIVRSYVNYATFCMSQIARLQDKLLSNRQFALSVKRALQTNDRILLYAVGMSRQPSTQVPTNMLDQELLTAYLQTGSELQMERTKLSKQFAKEACQLLFGWNNSGTTLRYYFEAPAIEWLLSFPRFIDPTTPLQNTVGNVARAIGMFFILQKVAPEYFSNAVRFKDPNDITKHQAGIQGDVINFLLRLLGSSRDTYMPIWWKQKHLRLIMTQTDNLSVGQVYLELEKVYQQKLLAMQR